MTIKEILEKVLGNIDDFLRETGASLLSHFIITTTEGEGDQKKVTRRLDVNAIRRDAPFFMLQYADEAAYNGLKIDLDPGLQMNLEQKMAVQPLPPGALGPLPAPLIGNHQRADIILTIVNMLVPENMGMISRPACRHAALERLRQLALIDDDQEWVRAAVADKLMKANESDYLGAYLTVQAQEAFRYLVHEFFQAKAQYDIWANNQADHLRTWTATMRGAISGPARPIVVRRPGFLTTLRRMFDLPWECS